MTLRTKMWLLIVSSTMAGFILLFLTGYFIGEIFNKGYTHLTLHEIGTTLAETAQELGDDTTGVIALIEQVKAEHPSLQLEWLAADGSMLHATSGRTAPYTFQEMSDRFINMPFSLWESGKEIAMVFSWKRQQQQYLYMTLPGDSMKNNQLFFYMRNRIDLLQLLIPAASFILAPYVIVLLYFQRMSKRLQRLNTAMNAVDAQGSTIALEDSSRDEIGQLTRRFNSMSERIGEQVGQIQQLENKRKTLIANLSHDLRTPMTMIHGYAETLHSGLYRSEEEKRAYTDIIMRRSQYMNRLLQQLLEISRLDAEQEHAHLSTVDCAEQLRRIAVDYVHTLEAGRIALDVSIPEHPVYTRLDIPLFERAVRNLIENAIQYGGSGGYLGLSLEQRDDLLYIVVTDRGPGIPEHLHRHIFERFFRASEGREGDGIGIGLSIVQEVAAAHGGRVEMSSVPGRETSFHLILP
ncbi:HAMP domain-containing histidine kinase [Paenibacillus sp. J5C_2022]|uniref:sensor histidine kinase n=1 Tax=Paenibacillus sp. J5C2022 TaxID=2977129 RepID=UPI0021D23D0E|nr:HAMP domain-containing sensor histidine kinase [Paenibacillus sp. J5C2022]MCU6710549.1 HAMP domain-containing histidine kinase [Paenibacillus sp. J5C2022]